MKRSDGAVEVVSRSGLRVAGVIARIFQAEADAGYPAEKPLPRRLARRAAEAPAFEGMTQPNAYTEPRLHRYAKAREAESRTSVSAQANFDFSEEARPVAAQRE